MDTTARPLSSIGIDIGKEVFHVVGFGTDGKIAFRRKIIRREIAEACSRAADAADEPLLGRLNILQCAARIRYWDEASDTEAIRPNC